MRATWCTDIHLNFPLPRALRQFYEAIEAEAPDIVLLSGDIAESDSVVHFVDEIATQTGAKVYFVLGNHDYYRSSIRHVREQVTRIPKLATWLPGVDPVRLDDRVVLLGVDGWGDARCGDLDSPIQLSDWHLITDFFDVRMDPFGRIELLQKLGADEARVLREKLARAPDAEELFVLTHVPPFPQACWYAGAQSSPEWLPWFTCVSTGEVLAEYAANHPATRITVLCGHTHGQGVFEAAPNLVVRTGGWPPNVDDYGNPIVQSTFEF
ncbi:metallophosphoesterase [Polyangium sp. 15x6]|uniref:metallophosphoesterase family protein n=1 Tax=Polyangium sp. 15x6 TaxID=3042687 RepID=UPI00249BF7ED|nr:metallophosphoesterase [Polyangium sp. 15x6]MDI3289856.1 metallophosphoesterase [Polyangium sp. 15x6]